jgi:hypothetical protein
VVIPGKLVFVLSERERERIRERAREREEERESESGTLQGEREGVTSAAEREEGSLAGPIHVDHRKVLRVLSHHTTSVKWCTITPLGLSWHSTPLKLITAHHSSCHSTPLELRAHHI